jgi:putative membrane protein
VQARRLLRADLVFGLAAASVLVVGLVRVAYFEKGAGYYWHDGFFLAKFAAFLAAALISIYPTRTFLSWNRALQAGSVPQLSRTRTRRLRTCLMLESSAILVILWCAACMARGLGYFG